ncbi:MAG: bacterial Ig-like domain-containing protein [Acutalibacteraceae bacterium]
MRRTMHRGLSVLLTLLFAAALWMPAMALDGIYSEKTAIRQSDGTYAVTLKAYQTGRVVPTDIVMILDVSGSMECSEPVPYAQIDPAKTYCIKYPRAYIGDDGETHYKQYIISVHNIAPEGEEPQWYGQLEESGPEQQVFPKIADETGTYTFYTGAMEPLRQAATAFAQSIAQNAAEYDTDHRIAVVEFSSPEKKNDASLCTHDNPFYANILTADTTQAALLSAEENAAKLGDIFASLTAGGPTYSDDAMAQADKILTANKQDGRNRVVILFTDGGPGSYGWGAYDLDNSAEPTANNAIACAGRMKADGVKIYTIGVFNSENLSGAVGQKNEQYLNNISSNYPDAVSMGSSGEKAADGYCSVGGLHMDLSGAFDDISSVIGEPVRSAAVRDTVSRFFYMTAAQKQAILKQYPGAVIQEKANGETSVFISDIDLPPVAVDSNGEPLDAQDKGIFELTFGVTAREEFLGGSAVQTNTGSCGVFTADGVQLAAFAQPTVAVPVSEAALDSFLETGTIGTFYIGDTLRAQDLYVDKSDSWAAQFAAVRYSVTDAEGKPFTQGTLAVPTTYTVTAQITVGGEVFTRSKTVTVTPQVNSVQSMEIVTAPSKRKYYVGDSVELSGLSAYAWRKNGTAEKIDNSRITVTPAVLERPGTQTVTLEYEGVKQTFSVTVLAVEAVELTVKTLPTQTSYAYKKAPDFRGLTVEIRYNNGTKETCSDLSAMQITAASNTHIRRGTQLYRVTAQGVSATFPMQVKLLWWQWLIVILLFGWIWY